MPLYEYEALDHKGKEINGLVECSNENEVTDKLRDMGYFPVKTTLSGLDIKTGYEKTKKIKLSKAIAGFSLAALFFAAAIFVTSFPIYIKLVNLEGRKGNTAIARVTEIKASSYVEDSDPPIPYSYKIIYSFQVNGETHSGYTHRKADKEGKPNINENDVIQILYSIKYPALNQINKEIPPDSSSSWRALVLSGVITVVFVVIMFFASSWEHILGYKKAAGIDKAAAAIESRRITINFLSALQFPLIFCCLLAVWHGQDVNSIYREYRIILIAVLLIFVVVAIYINKISSKTFPA